MAENPFASFNVEIPKEYHEEVKKFCQTGGAGVNYEFAPFPRMVDFWYFCFMMAVKEGYEPKASGSGSVNITAASILSSDEYRIPHIQMAFLALLAPRQKPLRNDTPRCTSHSGYPHLTPPFKHAKYLNKFQADFS